MQLRPTPTLDGALSYGQPGLSLTAAGPMRCEVDGTAHAAAAVAARDAVAHTKIEAALVGEGPTHTPAAVRCLGRQLRPQWRLWWTGRRWPQGWCRGAPRPRRQWCRSSPASCLRQRQQQGAGQAGWQGSALACGKMLLHERRTHAHAASSAPSSHPAPNLQGTRQPGHPHWGVVTPAPKAVVHAPPISSEERRSPVSPQPLRSLCQPSPSMSRPLATAVMSAPAKSTLARSLNTPAGGVAACKS